MTVEFEKLQKAQNNLLRVLENVRVRDKVSIKKMSENRNTLSVNQNHAQIKIIEMQKSHKFINLPKESSTNQPLKFRHNYKRHCFQKSTRKQHSEHLLRRRSKTLGQSSNKCQNCKVIKQCKNRIQEILHDTTNLNLNYYSFIIHFKCFYLQKYLCLRK